MLCDGDVTHDLAMVMLLMFVADVCQPAVSSHHQSDSCCLSGPCCVMVMSPMT